MAENEGEYIDNLPTQKRFMDAYGDPEKPHELRKALGEIYDHKKFLDPLHAKFDEEVWGEGLEEAAESQSFRVLFRQCGTVELEVIIADFLPSKRRVVTFTDSETGHSIQFKCDRVPKEDNCGEFEYISHIDSYRGYTKNLERMLDTVAADLKACKNQTNFLQPDTDDNFAKRHSLNKKDPPLER